MTQLTWTLHEGILASGPRPPATPRSFAAVVVPTIADRLGARTFILELTYMNICNDEGEESDGEGKIQPTVLRVSSKRSARSQACSTAFHRTSGRGWPELVVAVIKTLMITAAGSTPVRSTFVGS